MTWGDVYCALNPGSNESDMCESDSDRVFFSEEIDGEAVSSLRNVMRHDYLVVVFSRDRVFGIFPAESERALAGVLVACGEYESIEYIVCKKDADGGWEPMPYKDVLDIVKSVADKMSGGET